MSKARGVSDDDRAADRAVTKEARLLLDEIPDTRYPIGSEERAFLAAAKLALSELVIALHKTEKVTRGQQAEGE